MYSSQKATNNKNKALKLSRSNTSDYTEDEPYNVLWIANFQRLVAKYNYEHFVHAHGQMMNVIK